MARKLPPLNSLQAFEAAARLSSVTQAAAELYVTQAAISHQIKTLENYLDARLFKRLPRRLVLTAAGQQLLPILQQSFNQIAATVAQISQKDGHKTLKIRLAPSFAAKWLSPRLKHFRELYPSIDLCLFHALGAVDFSREDIDIAVTYGRGNWPGVECYPVMQLDFFPVCSPSLLFNRKAITDLKHLANYTLLHDADYTCWADWLSEAGANSVNSRRGTIIDDTNVLIQAAIDGQGIALCSTLFVADHLQAGRLVRLFDKVLLNEYAYYIVYPKKHLQHHSVIAFRDWMLEQASCDTRYQSGSIAESRS